jgi:beta-galactosidase/beta-glucuronidase
MAHGYPRPQLRRANALNLNGPWLFAIDTDANWQTPEEVRWSDRQIEVPFAPETPASGIGDTNLYRAAWYRRSVRAARPPLGERMLLHFGAVDYSAEVWVNGMLAVTHEGGYTPFSADITDLMHPRGARAGDTQVIVVRAFDDPADMSKPRGKQDWQLEPHSIWYPRTTGIWQTVWLERVPATQVGELHWSSDLASFSIALDARLVGARRDDLRMRVRLSRGEATIADDTYSVSDMRVQRSIALPDPGIDAERDAWLWRPGRPTLLDARIELLGSEGRAIDAVDSYTALRDVRVEGDRFMLNGRPQRLRMALDQGYWPESGMTAPDDDALRRDVELAKGMGFNAVRKHQKIEDPRFLYWADTLGLMVWEEMPSAYAFDERAMLRLTREWPAAIERDRSHPCIVAWVPFNESWGLPDLANSGWASSQRQRDYAEAVYSLTKALDPTRPVITNDGWEHVRTDMLTVHDYDQDADSLGRRWGDAVSRAEMIEHGRVAGRRVTLAGRSDGELPLMLTEFGGIAFTPDEGEEGAWGYSRVGTAEGLAERYRQQLAAVRGIPALTGFCYTQLTDTYQEKNGLLFADRSPKFPIEQIARATRGR